MAKSPTEYGTSPVGRLVMGDPFNKQTKDQNGRDLPLDKQRFFFGIAVAKDAPGVNEMLGTMQKAAMEGYAHAGHVMAQIQMGLAATGFSWKVQDGDEMKVNAETGQQELRNKYGAGCWIFKFSTTLPIRPAKWQGNTPVDCTPAEIKRGFFVQVAYSTSANGNMDHTAGIYLNPQTICLVGYGEEIVGGPSLDQQFGSGPGGYVPSGMTQAPQGPTGAAPLAHGEGMPQMGNAQPPMGNGAGQAMPQGTQQGGMPGSGATNPFNSGQTAPQTASPSNPMGNGGGMTMPAPNSNGGATTSPTDAPKYGGFMQG